MLETVSIFSSKLLRASRTSENGLLKSGLLAEKRLRKQKILESKVMISLNNFSYLTKDSARVAEIIGKPWSAVTYEELELPLNSGICFYLLLQSISCFPIYHSISHQNQILSKIGFRELEKIFIRKENCDYPQARL